MKLESLMINMKTKIIYIPVDNRPAHTSWMKKFADVANIDLIMPKYEDLGSLYKKIEPKVILDLIAGHIKDSNYIILSTDALFSGGLVQSRSGIQDFDEINEISNELKALKALNKDIKIYAFDTLMRTTITTTNLESAHH